MREGRTPPTYIANSTLTNNMLIEVKHNILYCPVQKVGSSFWTNILKCMIRQGTLNSPYEENMNKTTKLIQYGKFVKDTPKYQKDWFLQNAISLLVVRDPYTKLFSGYADKLYSPNYLFWRILGHKVKIVIRQESDSNICGNDVSFSDYIKYIIYQSNSNSGRLEGHFTQIHEHCDPCTTKYDYIMKFENFKSDFFYIIRDWQTKFNIKISFKDFEKEAAYNISKKHIGTTFKTMSEYARKCNISEYNFILRSWRFLQISGVLPKDVESPFADDENAATVTKEALLKAVTDVLSHDVNWDKVKEQRHEALVQAYNSVDISDMIKLREIVKTDCLYFDYDSTPADLFQRSEKGFNYFDGLDLRNEKAPYKGIAGDK